ncbi:SRPBCC family protein [Odoribacter sp. AF15-53]|uniref:SRPBCC family protein n=1 Tax=Odoribacter sp. AF15-53 TaxID=2292236 RepID=UPI000E48ED9B|nr:SRPBCC family protein [Odoribacter sp. AF15-53]RHR79839.1 hypothetical protein DWW52_09755 [Odoribacter sp. AF15-53]
MRLLLCFVLMCCMSGLASAQMTAAKKIPPAVEKKVVLNANAQKVWDYLSEPGNYKKFSGVQEFTCEEKALNAKIELTTKAGKKRSQYISVIDYDNFKICYFVTKSDYAGDKQWVYAFEVKSKGSKKCEVTLSIYFGFDELSPEFKEGITKEFDDIVAGLKKKF